MTRLRIALLLGIVISNPIRAADMSAREIVTFLFNAPQEFRVRLVGLDLSFLDLSELDFKAATLAGSNLYGSDLTGANLSRTDLSRTVLDRATIVRADFSGADLSEALIRLPHAAGSVAFDRASSPKFFGANLSRARLVARLDGADFRNARLAHANLAPYGDTTQNTLTRRSVMIACDFSGAVLRGADLSEAVLQFSNFENAVLARANFSGADLTMANLTGADLTGANVADANFYGADLRGARGLEDATGIGRARNLDKAKR
jgi:uncharacterized protein YjbI with pentapeptide repeats